MEEIRPFAIHKLLDGDYYQFNENLVNKFNALDPAWELNAIVSPVQNDFVLMGESFKKSNATLFTKQVVALDKTRDHCFKLFAGIAEAFLYDNDHPEKMAAANTVLHTVAKYGGKSIANASFTSETALLTNLVTDLENVVAAEVAVLNLTETATALKTKNEAFKTYYEERSDELTIISNIAPLRILRPGFTKNYRNLSADLESAYRHSTGAKQEAIGHLIDSINTEIKLFEVKIPKKGTPKPA